ncbi:MAG TPA: shikimate dehydrogenase [Firmicutes bacterium]|nr:shikimate dehydrogenase [Bacillota bacterium]
MSRKFALLGHPLGHTMSPPIHQRLFALSGDPDVEYLVRDVPLTRLAEEMPALLQMDGLNVTIPHKMSVIRYLDDLDDSARRYGAVNVIRCGEKNIGYNTDVDGFIRSIESLGAPLDKRVLLLGCGGVGRMMAIESGLRGGDLTLAVRPEDLEKAHTLSKDLEALTSRPASIQLLTEVSEEYDLLINATPVGMYPNCDACAVSPEVLGNCRYVFDAIYNPGETKLMQLAKEQGAQVMGGMAMLVWQAVVAHEIWDHAHYNPEDIQQLIRDMEADVTERF